MDRVKQFLMVRPLLEPRPSADASASPPMAAPSSAPSTESATPPTSRDRRRDALLMLMLLRTFGRRT